MADEVATGPSDLANPSKWAFNLHRDDLLKELEIRKDYPGSTEPPYMSKTYRINLVHLQRLHLRELQARLVKEVIGLYTLPQGTTNRENLRNYGIVHGPSSLRIETKQDSQCKLYRITSTCKSISSTTRILSS